MWGDARFGGELVLGGVYRPEYSGKTAPWWAPAFAEASMAGAASHRSGNRN